MSKHQSLDSVTPPDNYMSKHQSLDSVTPLHVQTSKSIDSATPPAGWEVDFYKGFYPDKCIKIRLAEQKQFCYNYTLHNHRLLDIFINESFLRKSYGTLADFDCPLVFLLLKIKKK